MKLLDKPVPVVGGAFMPAMLSCAMPIPQRLLGGARFLTSLGFRESMTVAFTGHVFAMSGRLFPVGGKR